MDKIQMGKERENEKEAEREIQKQRAKCKEDKWIYREMQTGRKRERK